MPVHLTSLLPRRFWCLNSNIMSLMWLAQQLIIWSFHGLFAQMWNEVQRCKKELHASLLTMNFSTTAVQGVLYNSHQLLPIYSTPFKKACPMANSYTSDDTTWTSTLAPVPITFTLCTLEGKLFIPSSVQLIPWLPDILWHPHLMHLCSLLASWTTHAGLYYIMLLISLEKFG